MVDVAEIKIAERKVAISDNRLRRVKDDLDWVVVMFRLTS